jgi:solute:Na+ symporter, SSS family
VYTMSGGAKAVAHTQKLQMIIVFAALFLAGYLAVKLLPPGVGFVDALKTAGLKNKLNIITTGFDKNGSFDWNDKYNLASGLIGGFFLLLSYFGTDHSQVGRYLTAKNNKESKVGLLMNGIVKVPMQFSILILGILVFSFYQYNKAPIYFDEVTKQRAETTVKADSLIALEKLYENEVLLNNENAAKTRVLYANVIKRALPNEKPTDTNYIFLVFVKQYLPKGLVGLIFAIIIIAAWGSIAAALNSLAACSVVDIHKKFINTSAECDDYKISKLYTLGWGIFCIAVSMFATTIGNSLIEAVNILGSIFYGVILGVFLAAFWLKKTKGNAVFWAAIISQVLVIVIYKMQIISFLWLNVIGALLVLLLALLLNIFMAINGKTK